MNSMWIPLDKIQYLIQLETFIVCGTLIALSYVFYMIYLRAISEKRHRNLKERFIKTVYFFLFTTVISAIHWWIFNQTDANALTIKIGSYLSVLALFLGAITLIKMAQIFVYLYLFFANMSHGVPRLIANMFTFAFSLVIVGLIASTIFGIHLSAVLASSAIFSLILGLALQDTLGNLFSGVALQIDKPFEIGDWLEVMNGQERLVGQVQEITWRATYLLGLGDETILIPNRMIAQSQMLIFSKNHKPPRFNQLFRIQYGTDIEQVKNILLSVVKSNSNVLEETEPRVLVMETSESWITLKVFYSLSDYGLRFRTGDVILRQILKEFEANNIKFATPSMKLVSAEN